MKFETPDETVNFFFARQMARTGAWYYDEPFNTQFTEPIVFMRWTRAVGARMYPGTFVGLIAWYGVLGRVFGVETIPFWTPLFAVLSVFLFFLIVRRLFNERVGAWSALVLAFFPSFWYYASRTLFHNILFLFFFLLGVWFLLRSREQPRGVFGYSAASAFSFAAALWVRTSEVWWVCAVIAVLFLIPASAKNLKTWISLAGFLIGVGLLLSPIFVLNHRWYGDALNFGFGYGAPSLGSFWHQTQPGVRYGAQFLFPFGIHFSTVKNIFLSYLWKPYWPYLVLAAVGFFVRYRSTSFSERKKFFFGTGCLLFVVCYVVLLYGSWQFFDSADIAATPLSSSYYRYFLPIFVFLIPFGGYTLVRVQEWMALKKFSIFPPSSSYGGRWRIGNFRFPIFQSVIIVVYLIFSGTRVFFSSEGLWYVRSRVIESQRVTQHFLSQAGPADLILVPRGKDKVIFPDFLHVVNAEYIGWEKVLNMTKDYPGKVWRMENDRLERVNERNR